MHHLFDILAIKIGVAVQFIKQKEVLKISMFL